MLLCKGCERGFRKLERLAAHEAECPKVLTKKANARGATLADVIADARAEENAPKVSFNERNNFSAWITVEPITGKQNAIDHACSFLRKELGHSEFSLVNAYEVKRRGCPRGTWRVGFEWKEDADVVADVLKTKESSLCNRCGESEAVVKLSATDLQGVLLDTEKCCRQCAVDAGFEVGAGGTKSPFGRTALRVRGEQPRDREPGESVT